MKKHILYKTLIEGPKVALVALIIISISAKGQANFNTGVPILFKDTVLSDSLDTLAPLYRLPLIDNSIEKIRADQVKANACNDCGIHYYGKGNDVNIDFMSQALVTNLPGGTLRLYKIESSSAYALQLYFSEFQIPFGAEMYVYNADKSLKLGAYTEDNNGTDPESSVQFGVQPIKGNTLYIEYYEPNWVDFQGTIRICNIIHVFWDGFDYAGPNVVNESQLLDCHKNVACPEGAGWNAEISATAQILSYKKPDQLAALCTGTMINNTNEDGRCLFLTANHCAEDNTAEYGFGTWHFLFNHQTEKCIDNGSSIGENPSYMMESVYGAIDLAKDLPGSPTSDYLLLRLEATVEDMKNMEVCYAGWDRTATPWTITPYRGIHHPLGDVKKIATENDDIDLHPNKIDWLTVGFDDGATQPGSSGSALFSHTKKIVGQLYGGPTKFGNCPPNEKSYYGRFSESWTHGQLHTELDPINSGVTSVNAYCPVPPHQVHPDPGAQSCSYFFGGGMTLNGNSNFQGVACISGDITLEPYNPNNCDNTNWRWGVTVKEYKCGNLPGGSSTSTNCDWKSIINPIKCRCYFHEYFIEITEVDANLNPIGPAKAKWFKDPITAPGLLSSISNTADLRSQVVVNSSKLSALGVTLDNGKYYRIKLAIGYYGWTEEVRYFRQVPQSHSVTGNITTGQYAYADVNISNATVSQDVDVLAGNTINMSSVTTLTRGYYGINYNLCDPNNTEPFDDELDDNGSEKTGKSVLEQIIESPDNAPKTTTFSMYPNPAQDNITLDFFLPDARILSISIIDSRGKVLKEVLTNNVQAKGFHQLKVETTTLESGLYFVLFEVNGKIQSHKLQILK